MKVKPSPLVHTLYGSCGDVTIRRYRGQLVAAARISNTPPPAEPPPPVGFDIIHDNSDPGFSYTAGTVETTYPGYYGPDYVHLYASRVTPSAIWYCPIPYTAPTTIYAWWPTWLGWYDNCQYIIQHDDGRTNHFRDQSAQSQQWVLLGTHTLSPGTSYVNLRTAPGKRGAADAIRLIEVV